MLPGTMVPIQLFCTCVGSSGTVFMWVIAIYMPNNGIDYCAEIQIRENSYRYLSWCTRDERQGGFDDHLADDLTQSRSNPDKSKTLGEKQNVSWCCHTTVPSTQESSAWVLLPSSPALGLRWRCGTMSSFQILNIQVGSLIFLDKRAQDPNKLLVKRHQLHIMAAFIEELQPSFLSLAWKTYFL